MASRDDFLTKGNKKEELLLFEIYHLWMPARKVADWRDLQSKRTNRFISCDFWEQEQIETAGKQVTAPTSSAVDHFDSDTVS